MTSGPRAAGVLLPALLVAGCSSAKPSTTAGVCSLAKSEQAQTVTFSRQFSAAKPADLKPVVGKALAQLSGFDAAAPPDIAGATHTYVTDERNFLNVIKTTAMTSPDCSVLLSGRSRIPPS